MTEREDEIFGRALEMPDSERAAFLDQACAGDPAMRQRIAAVLAGLLADSAFLEKSAAERPTFPPEEQPGDRIDRYILERKIGDGGCGVVYLAEQTEPVRRHVALKVIKLGMDTRRVVSRFQTERQALALMDHPDIARVLDAGATGAGRPFFVMEFVDGVPITKFCEQHKLSITGRVELIIRVCLALQHAHQKGIIHRDLKPSNILVAWREDQPTPKVIDFGVAKATQGEIADRTTVTAVELFIGTPGYMSPEQAGGAADIDTRSDIYSLGVLLYELLTGRTPFDTRELLQAGLDELRRRIRDEEPLPPSNRLDTIERAELAGVAGTRGLTPPRLVDFVRGDLDSIVMRCLEKDRARRYETALGLAQDLRRYLNHEPVEARPLGTAYRLRKLVRRHRVAVGAAAAVFAALLAGLAASTWQALRANRAERQARQEAAVARSINEFLTTDLLRQADSNAQADAWAAQPNPKLMVRDALDRAARKVGERFGRQPAAEAAVRTAIGESYLGLGLATEAGPHLQRAAELLAAVRGAGHPETLVAQARLARSLAIQNKLTEAAALQTETIAAQVRALAADDPAIDDTRNDLADTLEAQGKYAEAATLQREIIARRTRLLGPEHLATLTSMNNLGNAYFHAGKIAEAADWQSRALEARKRKLGPDHPATLHSMNDLASTYARQGKFAESAKIHAEALAVLERILGPDHAQTIASKINLATAYDGLGKTAEAEALKVSALESSQRVLGPDHTTTLAAMNNLANTYRAQQRFAEAAGMFERLRQSVARVLGPEHPNTLATVMNLGATYTQLGRLPEAVALLEEVHGKLLRTLGEGYINTLTAADNLASAYQALGRLDDAAALREKSLPAARRGIGPANPRTIGLMNNLAGTYDAQGRAAEAAALRREVLETQARELGAGHAQRLTTMAEMTTALLARENFAEAEPILRELLALREKSAPDAWSTFGTRSALGGALAGTGRFAEAEPLLLSGYEGMSQREAQIPPASRIRLKEALERLVRLSTALNRPEQAAEWQRKLDAQTKSASAPTKTGP